MLLAISKVTSTLSPTKAMPVTAPTGTPAIRTCAPSFRPAMFGEHGLQRIALPGEAARAAQSKDHMAASTSATMVSRPIFSSDQASDRVRGISITSGQKSFQVRVALTAARSSPALPSKAISPPSA